MSNSGIKNVTIVVEPNTEDSEIGGFFASFIDGWGRGFGFTELQAITALALLKAEQEEEVWEGFAGDLISTTVIRNRDIEKALERRYGGRIDYDFNQTLSQ